MPSNALFDMAATACGHDVSTETGKEAARADHRVWDLAGQYQAEVDTAAAGVDLPTEQNWVDAS